MSAHPHARTLLSPPPPPPPRPLPLPLFRLVALLNVEFETKYDLVANICHNSPSAKNNADASTDATKVDPMAEGSYHAHVQAKATGQWYEMQDLHVQETMAQLIGLSESYMLIYRRKS